MDVAIAGAGISGLAAAISLRRCGHRVTIYERSSMNNELGAAINIPPNVSRFLVPWGLDPVRSRLVTSQGMWFVSPTTLEELAAFDHSHNDEKFGSPLYYAHRVDLHESLKRMATEPGFGTPVDIRLKCAVSSYVNDPELLILRIGGPNV
jgi:salicylate hydroxylase